jgi:hypothetical protein
MKTYPRKHVFLACFTGLVLIVSLVLAGAALAFPTAITLERFVIAGGGGQVQADGYDLAGTIGQAVVGREQGPETDLCSGFWCQQGKLSIYLPLLLRDD